MCGRGAERWSSTARMNSVAVTFIDFNGEGEHAGGVGRGDPRASGPRRSSGAKLLCPTSLILLAMIFSVENYGDMARWVHQLRRVSLVASPL